MAEEYLYGKLNKLVEQKEYKGSQSDNIKVTVDNQTATISADLIEAVATEDFVNQAIASVKREFPKKTSQLENDGDGNSKFATEDFVKEKGGKIDSITVSGKNLIIDKNKNVNIPSATDTMSGVVKIVDDNGIGIENGILKTISATNNEIDEKTNQFKTITPGNLDYATESVVGNQNSLKTTNKKLVDSTNEIFDTLQTTKSNLNTNVLESISITTNGDDVKLNSNKINLDTNTTSSTQEQFELATSEKAGLMSSQDVKSISDLQQRVENLEGKTTRLLYKDKTDPTEEEINAFVISQGYTKPFSGVGVVVDQTFHV